MNIIYCDDKEFVLELSEKFDIDIDKLTFQLTTLVKFVELSESVSKEKLDEIAKYYNKEWKLEFGIWWG